ncbi:GTP 3',8-cyclase MoaA [Pleomorphovibrio marinus]|uniref:GTP 3',8-cyclase MoaA n=1 Tax=Pleomorphovibrio marinus TaxID=2164132 RepID=UPI000E0A6BF5|nr:GTP 3',8-cyclase MoaA [Pleomorphovibrio marinus]
MDKPKHTEPTLIDPYGRKLDYLRLSVTDRCNFRCYYCMPEEGVEFVPRKELLTYEELSYLTGIFCELGVRKVRITGGEPFVRKGIMGFLGKLSDIPQLQQITVTSNGTLGEEKMNELLRLGITNINISLDSLDKERFFEMTRRDKFEEVFDCILALLQKGFKVKLNCVLAEEKNIQDIIPFVELTKSYPLSVRFLEEMPFNGKGSFETPKWNYKAIFSYISGHYSEVEKLLDEKNSTSTNYRIKGYQGSFGIIPSYSRTFCGTCNRIRLSATGEMRTCLYGPPRANLRDVLREGADKERLIQTITDVVAKKEKDGFEAEKLQASTPKKSMTFLGG